MLACLSEDILVGIIVSISMVLIAVIVGIVIVRAHRWDAIKAKGWPPARAYRSDLADQIRALNEGTPQFRSTVTKDGE